MVRRLLCAVAAVVALSGCFGPPPPHQGRVVSADPLDTTPHVLDGRVYAIAEVGSKVVVGGQFSEARDQGATARQPRTNLLAYDRATGRIDQGFAPQVDGVVNAVVADPGGSAVFVGGAFLTVNGRPSRGLVKLDLATGAAVEEFQAVTTAVVNDLDLRGSKLYVGGNFGMIKGVSRKGLAAVDTTSGAVDPNLNLPVTTPMFSGAAGVEKIDVAPNGSRLVLIGNFAMVGGQPRTQMAMVDLSTTPASVSSWQTDRYGNVCNPVFPTYMRDVDISPNGAYAVVVTTGSPYGTGTTLCDTAARWEIGRSGAGQQPTWVDWTGGDTLLSVGISDAAVYVGGHQRWHNNSYGHDSPGIGAVARDGIVALDPLNGRPLRWNPGRTRGYGATALLITPTGLYVGSDTESLGGEYHARLGMFPVEGGATVPVARPAQAPTAVYAAGADGRLTKHPFDGSTFTGNPSVVSGPDVDGRNWSSVRGTFMVNGVAYVVAADGTMTAQSFDGTTFGPAVAVPLVFPLTDVSAVAYANGFLYSTKPGDGRLYRQGMTLDGFVVDARPVVVSGAGDGLNWSSTVGLTVVSGRLLAADTARNLTSTQLVDRVPAAATRTTVSGPAVDGRNWNAVDVFAGST